MTNSIVPALASLLFVSSCILVSCKKDTTAAATATCTSTISFNSTIQPLISQNCSTSGCHNSSNAGGYNLTTHTQISANANIILKSIRHESGVNAMPQGTAKLSTANSDNFDCWIQQGKLDN